ncbi:phosphoacetylglucosamine mutase-like isoform X1 [Chenopodium quinoa]|uniref:phosphoacetylglucosamine mutase-like isoform X1 n=2 Tax=Chenopodium quinoa TaxID=63459 RepID=UPI000B77D62B|nr:phosphoacetylglucosamine mutase-like isoform X1 [Chenopodium quinoa]
MNQQQRNLILQSSSNFPPPKGVKLSYGTAGFRTDATLLRSTLYRVGILAALRSLKTQSLIGLMITASHNKVSDNGVKIADPNGGMLSQNWEPFADSLANAADPLQLLQLIEEFVRKENISFDNAYSAEILLGRDTRPSGESLLEAAKQGISSITGAIYHDMGILTTPQLHWMVRARNMGMNSTEQDYFEQLSHSYRCLVELIPDGIKGRKSYDKVVVDGANGVGGDKLDVLKDMCGGLSIELRNSSKGEGVLNEGVGADFVQKEKVMPSGFGPNDVGLRCASFDGDADRLVYFLVQPDSKVIDLVDGDKMLSLFALFIKEQLDVLKDIEIEKPCEPYHPRLGIVQTAYANGASTDYLKNLGLDVVFTPTGVKYLHEKASQYDIGIYFEANGHGTILFSDSVLSWLEARNSELSSSSTGSENQKAVLRLLAASKLINQAVGDALSGLLLVEAILLHTGWSIQKWNELYKDLPSRQLKVKVVDRTAVVTANAETIVVQPAGIQDAIDTATAKYHHGRCFIRPSGTEEVIRVYAEATTQEEADNLASDVAKLVDQFLGLRSSQ